MKKALALAALFAVLATGSQAACYADYKAKREQPLRLSYGVIQISDGACGSPAKARAEVSRRIAADGWQLLNVLSVFGPEGLDQRKASAGAYFLRY